MTHSHGDLHCPVLTYHSQNVFADFYGKNDHISLQQDLQTIQSMAKRVVPLQWLVDCLLDKRPAKDLENAVCLTADDGCNTDVFDLDFPGHGMQKSFSNILAEFKAEYSSRGQAELQMTAFVIASPQAREIIDRQSLFGKGWMSDDWWAQTQQQGLLDIQNHGWDHKHLRGDKDAGPDDGFHRFGSGDCFTECEKQVRQAAGFIAERAARSNPQLFAYPYGESSPYIRETYLPQQAPSLGLEAAFSTEAEHVTRDSQRWALPRYVCGRDWKTPQQFKALLDG